MSTKKHIFIRVINISKPILIPDGKFDFVSSKGVVRVPESLDFIGQNGPGRHDF